MPSKAKSATDWKTKRRHPIVLSSGYEVEIEIPNLPLLVKTGQLPNDLVAQALGNIQRGELTPEIIASQAEFYEKLVPATVKNPEITAEDVKDLPFEDVEMIAEIATRQRDLDAVGNHVGGLNTSKEWRRFRGLPDLDEDVEGATRRR
jgi:hypothetical protein